MTCAYVFCAGALGDCILIWPLLRALARMGWNVHLVGPHSRGELARSWLGERVTPVDQESRWVTALWRGANDGRIEAPWAEMVIAFIGEADNVRECAWRSRVHCAMGSPEVLLAGEPGSASRDAVWRRFDVERRGSVSRRENPKGAIVLHVGAGSREKRWPLERWIAASREIRMMGHEAIVLAGEVERERFSADERIMFDSGGGRYLDTVQELAEIMSRARVCVAADTGPAHLSAQLGVATIALFGPTDPGVWSPRGPSVQVLRTTCRSEMSWLDVGSVVGACAEHLGQTDSAA